ncbi:MAG: ATP-binding cassette domain-containing protein [Pseudomonadota bacterium]|nr:ATP-binding cassette domain-containing protein [Pseudomonadota bacterium]
MPKNQGHILIKVRKFTASILTIPFYPFMYIWRKLSNSKNSHKAKRLEYNSHEENAPSEFSHQATLQGFLKLLKKYNLLWRFGLILLVSVGLEALSPLFIYSLYSEWYQAVVEKNMTLLTTLLSTMIISQAFFQLLTGLTYLMWRYLLGHLAMKNRKESAEAILTPKGIDIYVSNSKGKGAAVENAPQTIIHECLNFMANFIPLYQSSIRTIALVAAGVVRMIAAGLAAEAAGILFGAFAVMKLCGLFSKDFDRANTQEFHDSSRALNLFVGLRTEKNLHTYPNAKVLVGDRIHQASDKILENQTSRYRNSAVLSIFTGLLQNLAGPLLTTFVLAKVYFPSISTMTYATFGQLVQIGTSLIFNIVEWGASAEWWSKMHISLENVKKVQKHIVEPARHNSQQRVSRDGLSAHGVINFDSEGLKIDVDVKSQQPGTDSRGYYANDIQGCRQPIAVSRGDYTLLVGHNGAGKTTLLDCITQAIPNVDTKNNTQNYSVLQISQQTNIPAYVRGECKHLAKLNRSLFAFICYHWPNEIQGDKQKFLTQSETLPGKGFEVRRKDIEKKVYDNLRMLNFKPELEKIEKRIHPFFHSLGLSGGEKQKLFAATFLAIAQFAKVDILILDEITAGMDSSSTFAFQNMMQDFQAENKDMIIFEVFHRTDCTKHGLNQRGKKIWMVSSEYDNKPAVKTFSSYTDFASWAATDEAKYYLDVHDAGKTDEDMQESGSGWIEYHLKMRQKGPKYV